LKVFIPTHLALKQFQILTDPSIEEEASNLKIK